MNPASPVPGFFVVAAAAVALVFLAGAATFLLIVICCRIARRAAVRRVLEDLDRRADACLRLHPNVQEGLDRLKSAVRDEQEGTS